MSCRLNIGLTEFLPFQGIHILLGNDLAGGEVFANPTLTDKQSIENSSTVVGKEFDDLYSSCAVIRSMSNCREDNSDVNIDLSDSFLAHDSCQSPEVVVDNFQVEESNIFLGQKNDPEILPIDWWCRRRKQPQVQVAISCGMKF